MENIMKVTNVDGTTDTICKCGTWLGHWKKFGGGALPSYCAEKICMNKPEVGAHVQKDSSTDKSWYIVPLCSQHNRETEQSLNLADSTTLVSANVSQTCGKK